MKPSCVCVHACLWDLTWEGAFSYPGPNLQVRFFLRGLFFGFSEESGCTAVFSVFGMHVSVSLRQVLGSEHCSCSVCVCSTVYVTTRTLDDLCVVRPHLGHIFVPWTKRATTFFLRGLFSGPRKMCVFVSPHNSTKTCVSVCVSTDAVSEYSMYYTPCISALEVLRNHAL